MDMNGSEGILRVSIDIYLHSCSELEYLHESNKLRLLCRGPDWQRSCFNDSIQSHYCISGKMCVFLDKACHL
jgi:hypothetical protein